MSRAEAESTSLAELLDRYQREIATQKHGAAMERSHLRMIRQDLVAHGFFSGITGKELTLNSAVEPRRPRKLPDS